MIFWVPHRANALWSPQPIEQAMQAVRASRQEQHRVATTCCVRPWALGLHLELYKYKHNLKQCEIGIHRPVTGMSNSTWVGVGVDFRGGAWQSTGYGSEELAEEAEQFLLNAISGPISKTYLSPTSTLHTPKVSMLILPDQPVPRNMWAPVPRTL